MHLRYVPSVCITHPNSKLVASLFLVMPHWDIAQSRSLRHFKVLWFTVVFISMANTLHQLWDFISAQGSRMGKQAWWRRKRQRNAKMVPLILLLKNRNYRFASLANRMSRRRLTYRSNGWTVGRSNFFPSPHALGSQVDQDFPRTRSLWMTCDRRDWKDSSMSPELCFLLGPCFIVSPVYETSLGLKISESEEWFCREMCYLNPAVEMCQFE